MAQPIERFTSKVEIDPATGCHNWIASTNGRNYGKFFVRKVNGRAVLALAHRWAYEYYVGAIPDGYVIDHLCYNTRCVNPSHLEAVTPAENVRRIRDELRPKVGQNYWSHCKQGHPLEGDNIYVAPKDGKRRCATCQRRRSAEWGKTRIRAVAR